MEKRILLPTDFSKNSWNAILYAIKLFENNSCDFYILHTYAKEAHGLDNTTLLDPEEGFNKLSEFNSKKGLGEILIRLSELENTEKHNFHVVSESSLLLNAVKKLNSQLHFNMIVLGAKGNNSKSGETYGKHTLEILKNVRKCPILVVPANVDFNIPKEIVLTTNFNTRIKESEITHLVEIAKLSNACIQVLSLTQPKKLTFAQKRNKVYLRKHLSEVAHNFNTLRNVKMATALSCFIDIRQANMISYIDKKPTLLERIGLRKLSLNKLGFHPNIPVLALHSK
ncbi:universal stress protein [Maribacter hydrothermalis]|uniref:UspA domain-containing protein n=1 Tax=Maribacter hydrothermalis TaxID=1836467 RepID=A0A1B7Z2D2_9FLAO|nr:universal stress protein [Maribacter hydrothermalis]APQ18364.1 hypothetical protein BTR34_13970 [Maribacter hydrothermalis]OBR36710.1 hypothetical protein A9200_09865 [Maribacter hydrothermalis]